MGGKVREKLSECSLPAALEAMGERWSFMILRAAFNGLQHFEEFQSELGIARNILANRLARLVDHGILTREALPEDRRKIEYRLTEKGVDLLPVLVAISAWTQKHYPDTRRPEAVEVVQGGPKLLKRLEGKVRREHGLL